MPTDIVIEHTAHVLQTLNVVSKSPGLFLYNCTIIINASKKFIIIERIKTCMQSNTLWS